MASGKKKRRRNREERKQDDGSAKRPVKFAAKQPEARKQDLHRYSVILSEAK
jgi:hypothetical protein